MSFVDQIPEHIKTLDAEITKLGRQRADINWGHECDCEYCDREGRDADLDAEEKADAIDKAQKDHQRIIVSLKNYAKRMGVELEDVTD